MWELKLNWRYPQLTVLTLFQMCELLFLRIAETDALKSVTDFGSMICQESLNYLVMVKGRKLVNVLKRN